MKRSYLATVLTSALLWCSPGYAASLAVVGTGDGMEMLQAVSALFSAERFGVVVSVPPSIGSGGAVAAVGGDRNVLGRVARPLKDAEKEQGLETTPIVRIPSAFFVHPGVGVRAQTTKQIKEN
jgi:phosphate transport system substrate-binding protein